MPGEVARILAFFSAEDLTWKPASWEGIPGEKFSAIEQICHLRDIETDGYHKRIQAMITDDSPSLSSIEGYELALQRKYENEHLPEVVSSFKQSRQKTLSMLESLDSSQWNRKGYFEGYGNITLKSLMHFLCSHDLEHLSSLRWMLGKLEGEKVN